MPQLCRRNDDTDESGDGDDAEREEDIFVAEGNRLPEPEPPLPPSADPLALQLVQQSALLHLGQVICEDLQKLWGPIQNTNSAQMFSILHKCLAYLKWPCKYALTTIQNKFIARLGWHKHFF